MGIIVVLHTDNDHLLFLPNKGDPLFKREWILLYFYDKGGIKKSELVFLARYAGCKKSEKFLVGQRAKLSVFFATRGRKTGFYMGVFYS